jgi:hypothetical protein
MWSVGARRWWWWIMCLLRGRRFMWCSGYWMKRGLVRSMFTLWLWPSFLSTLARNCCAGVAPAESMFRAFWYLGARSKRSWGVVGS